MSGYSFGRRGRAVAVAPTDDFDNLGVITENDENRATSATRSTLANRAMSAMSAMSATEKKERVYFKNLRKRVSNLMMPFQTNPPQNVQQPPIAAQGTTRQPPYYISTGDNTYFTYVPPRRDRVMSRGRLAAEAEKSRSGQTIGVRVLPTDIFRKIFKYSVAHDKIVLDIKLLNTYINEHRNGVALSGVNNDEYKSFLQNILTVHLDKVEITDAILEILKNTIVHSNISTIILRKITFSNDEICKNFLEYLSENTKLKILILDDVGIDRDNFNNFLSILENFKDLELLEFSNFNITRLFKVSVINNVQFHYFFMKVIINLHALNYLIFNNNTVTKKDYTYLFNKLNDVNNYYVIDLGRYGIYLKYNDNKDDKNKVKSGEQFMHIIEIDTAGRKILEKCVDRYYIEFHTHGNKDADADALIKLNDFRHKYIREDATDLFEEYKVPLNLLSTF